MSTLQKELDDVVKLWNSHRIRSSKNQIALNGRPVLMYHLPQLYGYTDQLCNVDDQRLTWCEEECDIPDSQICDKTVYDLCCIIMQENNMILPSNHDEAQTLYLFLRNEIRQHV